MSTPINIGAAMAGGNGKRRADDFYPTPYEATEALMQAVGKHVGPLVHEPACGDGAMARVIELYGHKVIGTDLVARGYGDPFVDYLDCGPLAPAVITNPPFKLAADFIETTLDTGVDFAAFLLKATFWNAGKRVALCERHPPSMVLPVAWRIDFTGQGAPTMDCAWFVWIRGFEGQVFRPLPRPTNTLSELML